MQQRHDDLIFINTEMLAKLRGRWTLPEFADALRDHGIPVSLGRLSHLRGRPGVGKDVFKRIVQGLVEICGCTREKAGSIRLDGKSLVKVLIRLADGIGKTGRIHEWPIDEVREWIYSVERAVTILQSDGDAEKLMKIAQYVQRLYVFYWDSIDIQRCRKLLDSLLDPLRRSEKQVLLAGWLHEAAVLHHETCSYLKSEQLCREGLAAAREPDGGVIRGHLLQRLGSVKRDLAEIIEARRFLDEAWQTKQRYDSPSEQSSALSALAEIDLLEGSFKKAIDEQSRCLKQMGCSIGVRRRLARAHRHLGEYKLARHFIDINLTLLSKSEDRYSKLTSNTEAAIIAILEGDMARAKQIVEHVTELVEGMLAAVEAPHTLAPGTSLEFAFAAQQVGNSQIATRLYKRLATGGPPCILNKANAGYGVLLVDQGDMAMAEMVFRRAVAAGESLIYRGDHPHDVRHWLALAELALNNGRAAGRWYETAMQKTSAAGVCAFLRIMRNRLVSQSRFPLNCSELSEKWWIA